MAGHSRVNSSMTLSSFKVRPSTVTGRTGSRRAHRAFGRIGHIAPTWAPTPREALLAAPVGHLQAFVTPQPPDPLVVDLPAGPAGVLRARRQPHRGRRSGEVSQELPQPLLFVVDDGLVEALGGAVLADDPARSAFGDPEPFPQHLHCAARRRFGVRSFPWRSP